MKLLLDTHVLIWWMVEPHRLPVHVFDLISDEANAPIVSAVSGYEIELKRTRDALLMRLPRDLERAVHEARFEWMPVAPEHAIQAGRLPLHHRDPWDRLLIAQAKSEGITLISKDAAFAAYDVVRTWD